MAGGQTGVQNHLPGCVASANDDGRTSSEAFCAWISPISMNASPLNVVSVFVGDAGVCTRFSSKKVSPVIVRAGAILAV
jgi:hypothetical protein